MLFSYITVFLLVFSMTLAMVARLQRMGDTGKRRDELIAELTSQIELIRAKLIACAVQYPGGDNGTGIRPVYPAKPVGGLVKDLACPGAPVGYTALWSGTDGVYMPRVVPGADDWHYENDATSLRIFMSPSDPDSAMQAALNTIVSRSGGQATYSAGKLSVVMVN